MEIAFIGLGIMGSAMVSNLLKKGFKVCGWARNPQKIAALKEKGLILKQDIPSLVSDDDIVFTMVSGPKDVEDLYFREDGILKHVKKGCILIDCTSSSPELAVKIFNEALKIGVYALDMPVSGGQIGAVNGTLSMFAGGDPQILDRVKPILDAVASTVTYEGVAGYGQHTKLVNQIMVAGQLAGMCEGFAYAIEKGLNLEAVLKSVKPGAAGCASLDMYGEKILRGDKAPGGALKYLVKDLRNAFKELEGSGIRLSASEAACNAYAQMEEEGQGDDGTQALTWFYGAHRKS